MRELYAAVGIDLIEVAQVAASVARFGPRYLTRVFTAREIADCGEGPVSAERLAARFAAKEATVKALRPAEAWVDWREIEVRREACGAPTLTLHGRAAELAREAGLGPFALSLSHERAYATAVVVAPRARRARRSRPN